MGKKRARTSVSGSKLSQAEIDKLVALSVPQAILKANIVILASDSKRKKRKKINDWLKTLAYRPEQLMVYTSPQEEVSLFYTPEFISGTVVKFYLPGWVEFLTRKPSSTS